MEKSNSSQLVHSDSEDEQKQDKKVIPSSCLVCKSAPVGYQCIPCRCPTLCKKCAMKQATGGKCKTCGKMFGELARVVY